MWRDSARHASPNAGWPGAAMAGALGLKLAGPIAYDGVCQKKPWIGKGESSAGPADIRRALARSEEHTSELQSLMRISYAVFCLKKKNTHKTHNQPTTYIQ